MAEHEIMATRPLAAPPGQVIAQSDETKAEHQSDKEPGVGCHENSSLSI